MRGDIHFPGRGIGHMDLGGHIPIGTARLFGVMGTPAFGNTETPPALGDMGSPVCSDAHTPGVRGDIYSGLMFGVIPIGG